MKIYTYYQDINHSSQNELIDLWKISWSRQGYEPVVLNLEDAKKHSYFETLNTEMRRIFKEITNKEIGDYGMSCWFRWLAYATQEDEKFYVSDYDYININFKPCEPDDQLHLMVWHCPCFVSGSPTQFDQLCHDFVSVSNDRVDDLKNLYSLGKKTARYHDQDFFQFNLSEECNDKGPELQKKLGLKVTASPHKHCHSYDPISKTISPRLHSWLKGKAKKDLFQTAHFSHTHTVKIAKKYPKLFKGWNFEDVRVNIVERSIT